MRRIAIVICAIIIALVLACSFWFLANSQGDHSVYLPVAVQVADFTFPVKYNLPTPTPAPTEQHYPQPTIIITFGPGD